MNLPKMLLIFMSFLFVNLFSYSQKINKEGFYINLKGDTISGKFINYPEYNNSPSSVLFQPSGSSRPITLSPRECIQFSVKGGDTYLSYAGRRLLNATNYRNQQGKGKAEYENVCLFLRQLFNEAGYQLYELKDKKRENFYIRRGTDTLQELFYEEYTENGDIIESHVFRDQLYIFFTKNLGEIPNLQEQLYGVKYTGKSLANVFATLTGAKNKQLKEKYPAVIFAGVGASVNMLSVTAVPNQPPYGAGLFYTLPGAYKAQVSPVVEMGIKLFSQRNYGRLFFMVRVNAYQYQNTQDTASYTIKNTFKATVITVPFSAGYKIINTAGMSVAVSLGASGLYLINNLRQMAHTSGKVDDQSAYLWTLTYNIFGEAEIAWKRKTSFYAGYYFPTQIGNYVDNIPSHSSIKLGVRYHFLRSTNG